MTVHLVAHTHDDVGWRKTYEEYFTGASVIDDERAAVKDILDSLLVELERDPRRKFTYVEMKFFTMWYNLLKQKDKDRVKKLVHNGQLDIT